jgi:hypothetical protein
MMGIDLPPEQSLTSPAMPKRFAKPNFQRRVAERSLKDLLKKTLSQEFRRCEGLILFEWACHPDAFQWFQDHGWPPNQIERHSSHEQLKGHAADSQDSQEILIQGGLYALCPRGKCQPLGPMIISLRFFEIDRPSPRFPMAACLVGFHQVWKVSIGKEPPAYLQSSENPDLVLKS